MTVECMFKIKYIFNNIVCFTLISLMEMVEKQTMNTTIFHNTFNYNSSYFINFKNEQQNTVKEDL